jgi:hypothetical protein
MVLSDVPSVGKQIIDGKGTWKYDQNYDSTWVMPVTFIETTKLGLNKKSRTKTHFYDLFRFNKNKPPFEIFIEYSNFLPADLVFVKTETKQGI